MTKKCQTGNKKKDDNNKKKDQTGMKKNDDDNEKMSNR